MPTLSIIAVTYNEARHIAKLKTALRALHNPTGVAIESIVVDGGSRDGTVDTARAAGFTRIIELPGASIPVCRNKGLEAATGAWIAFLDGDCEPAPDWLENARPLLERNEAIAIGWPARPPEPMTWVQACWLFHWEKKNPRMGSFAGVQAVVTEGFRLVTTRNLILHRKALSAVPAFNEELATGEDTDFVFRLAQASVPVLGLPTLRVVHHGEPVTLRQWFRQQLWHANRKSYQHIQKLSGGKVGGNAPRFTQLFAGTLAVAIAGCVLTGITANPLALLLLAPWLGLIMLPAARVSLRGGTMRYFCGLCALYAAYGLARTIDLLGWHPQKASWKAQRPSTRAG